MDLILLVLRYFSLFLCVRRKSDLSAKVSDILKVERNTCSNCDHPSGADVWETFDQGKGYLACRY